MKLIPVLSIMSLFWVLLLHPYCSSARADWGALSTPRDQGATLGILLAGPEVLAWENLRLVGGDGTELTPRVLRTGENQPAWASLSLPTPPPGEWSIILLPAGQVLAGLTLPAPKLRSKARDEGIWKSRRGWTLKDEYLYSAWIEALFSQPEGTSWSSLHEVTRNPDFNLLHNHLGLGEDDPGGLEMVPDCADNPWFLRAYFAWKTGLPFGYLACTRGTATEAPTCTEWVTNQANSKARTRLKKMARFLHGVESVVHAASARTALEDENTDLYPVALDRSSLWSGTVFADPYGHTLTLVRRIPQQGDEPGLLLAVDAQPDSTVEIKRFWEGNFQFQTAGIPGGPGFKRFRPIKMRHGQPRPYTNKELRKAGFPAWSLQQKDLSSRDFHDLMFSVINPDPVDPVRAYRLLHEGLHKQLETRVRAVEMGDQWVAGHSGTIPMPRGAGIFRTSGPWEDFSTPARDLRLLVAMDVLKDFPARLTRRAADFKTGEDRGEEKLKELGRTWASELSVTYKGSDLTGHTLTLEEVMARAPAFEMGYNPNDCPEHRWGAPPGTPEAGACTRRAPKAQQKQMKKLRKWFKERRRPVG